tara:strand:- start:430 stop:1425 length:996 start_codon:yes stop_codon:yes gene_type:complete
MDRVAGLTPSQRSELFQATAEAQGLVPAAVEKDFWVCWVLKKIYSNATLADQLLFKGGTSLSKCFALIERFSEDVDLVLDWRLITDENPYDERSNRQQDMFNKRFELAAQDYIVGALKQALAAAFGDVGQLVARDVGRKELVFQYPSAFSSDYIRPEILIEVSPMSAMAPSRELVIQSYSAKHFPAQFSDTDISVRTIEARKTFWDKITILHAEAHRPTNKDLPTRYSRHYYDIYQMLNTWVKGDALADLALLKDVAAFKNKFYPQGWAKYRDIIEGSVQLLPQEHSNARLSSDYKSMQEMIHGNYPEFSEVMAAIKEFETELNDALIVER